MKTKSKPCVAGVAVILVLLSIEIAAAIPFSKTIDWDPAIGLWDDYSIHILLSLALLNQL